MNDHDREPPKKRQKIFGFDDMQEDGGDDGDEPLASQIGPSRRPLSGHRAKKGHKTQVNEGMTSGRGRKREGKGKEREIDDVEPRKKRRKGEEEKGKVNLPSGPLADFKEPAWKRLITRAFLPHEVTSLIELILRSEGEVKMIGNLCGDDAQTFIEVIHEVPSPLPPFPRHGLITFVHRFISPPSNFHFPIDQALDLPDLLPRLRKRCLRVLCRICGRRALLPRSLQIPLTYDRLGTPQYRGGYADVWKVEHQGRHVAAKVLRVYSTTDLSKVTTVGSQFCWKHVGQLILTRAEVLQRGRDVECPSPSKCTATVGGYDG